MQGLAIAAEATAEVAVETAKTALPQSTCEDRGGRQVCYGTFPLLVPEARGLAQSGVRTEPGTLAESLTMQEARAGAGREIMQGRIRDPLRPEAEWAKMSHTHTTPEGSVIEVHYWRNRATGEVEDFKFKNP